MNCTTFILVVLLCMVGRGRQTPAQGTDTGSEQPKVVASPTPATVNDKDEVAKPILVLALQPTDGEAEDNKQPAVSPKPNQQIGLRPEPPIGKWEEAREVIVNGKKESRNRIRDFRPDGTLVLLVSAKGKKSAGTWKREGDRISFSLPATDDTKAENKWFTIVEATDATMTILMEGERRYTWTRLDQAKPVQEKLKDDLALLQGRWQSILKVGPKGKQLATDDPKHNQVLEVERDTLRLTVQQPDAKPLSGTFKLTPTDNPKSFDLSGTGPLGFEIEAHGIYELSKDTFKLSIAWCGKGKAYTRPQEFTGPQSGDYFVFKRLEVAHQPKEEPGKKIESTNSTEKLAKDFSPELKTALEVPPTATDTKQMEPKKVTGLATPEHAAAKPVILEAEDMVVLDKSSGTRGGPQNMSAFTKGRWNNDRQMTFSTRPDDFVRLKFEIANEGNYRIRLSATKGKDYGIVTFLINGSGPAGAKFDGYSEEVINAPLIDLGIFSLSKGANTLTVRTINKNTRSTNFLWGIDCLILEKASKTIDIAKASIEKPLPPIDKLSPSAYVKGPSGEAIIERQQFDQKLNKHFTQQGFYRNGNTFVLHGKAIAWYDAPKSGSSGKILAETWFYNGLAHGPGTVWHENGQKAQEGHYENGTPSGLWTSWHKHGKKKLEQELSATGLIHGKHIEWNEVGEMIVDVTYDRGVVMSKPEKLRKAISNSYYDPIRFDAAYGLAELELADKAALVLLKTVADEPTVTSRQIYARAALKGIEDGLLVTKLIAEKKVRSLSVRIGTANESKLKLDPFIIGGFNSTMWNPQAFASDSTVMLQFKVQGDQWRAKVRGGQWPSLCYPLVITLYDKNGFLLTRFRTKEAFTPVPDTYRAWYDIYQTGAYSWQPRFLWEGKNTLIYSAKVRDLRDAAIVEFGFTDSPD
jgi:uncharacterized protein (TIGR03067 family)